MRTAGAYGALVLVPLIFAVISLPMALEWVGPNAFYGARTAATRASEAEWYRINQLTGLAGVVGGLIGAAANLLIVRSGLGVTTKQAACIAVIVAVAVLMTATASAVA
ncbi:MAG: SdpI family protein [Porphyrobacter sp.]|nr:SdpI family protein [Porphyrobacter sp.]